MHMPARTQAHNQFPHLLLFSLKLRRVITKSLSTLSIELGIFRHFHAHTNTVAHSLTQATPLSLAPHLAHCPCTTLLAWFGCCPLSTLIRSFLIYLQKIRKKKSIYWQLLKYRNGKLGLDAKGQKDKKKIWRFEGKGPESLRSEVEGKTELKDEIDWNWDKNEKADK